MYPPLVHSFSIELNIYLVHQFFVCLGFFLPRSILLVGLLPLPSLLPLVFFPMLVPIVRCEMSGGFLFPLVVLIYRPLVRFVFLFEMVLSVVVLVFCLIFWF